jgi:hypothetical protein
MVKFSIEENFKNQIKVKIYLTRVCFQDDFFSIQF